MRVRFLLFSSNSSAVNLIFSKEKICYPLIKTAVNKFLLISNAFINIGIKMDLIAIGFKKPFPFNGFYSHFILIPQYFVPYS